MRTRAQALEGSEAYVRELFDTLRAYHVGRRTMGYPVYPDVQVLEYVDPRGPLAGRPYFKADRSGAERIVVPFQFGLTFHVVGVGPAGGAHPKIQFGEAKLIGDPHIVSVSEEKITNDGPEPLHRSEEDQRGKTSGESEGSEHRSQVEVTVNAGFEQTITAGGEVWGFGSETKLNVDLGLAVQDENKRQEGRSSGRSESKSGTTAYDILPFSESTESRQRSVGRWRQPVTITGYLDWGTVIEYPRGENCMRIEWASREEVAQVLRGTGTVREDRETWALPFTEIPWTQAAHKLDPRYDLEVALSRICHRVHAVFETSREFERAEKIETVVRQRSIAGGAA